MKASFWTAVGSMLVPLGVLLAVEVPSWKLLAFWAIIAGLISFIAGWLYTIKEERQRSDKERLEREKDKAMFRQHRRETHMFLLVLSEISKRLGVNIMKVNRRFERWAEEEAKEDEKDKLDE